MLSAADIQNKEFKKATFGGYNIEEVNDFIEQIVKDYQELLSENYTLKDKVNALNESVQYYRTMESTIQNVLVLADKTAQDTKAAAYEKAQDTKSAAYEKAEQIKKEADERAERITALAEERVSLIINQGRQEAYALEQKVDETKRQYNAYKTQFKQLVQAQLDFLEQSDVRLKGLQENLTEAFDKIQVETMVEAEKEQAPSIEDPINEEETSEKVESIAQKVEKKINQKVNDPKSKDHKLEETRVQPTYAPLSKEEMDGLLN